MVVVYKQYLLDEGRLLKQYKKLRKQKKKDQKVGGRIGGGNDNYSDVDWRGDIQTYVGGGISSAAE